jgi:hypothetical protein
VQQGRKQTKEEEKKTDEEMTKITEETGCMEVLTLDCWLVVKLNGNRRVTLVSLQRVQSQHPSGSEPNLSIGKITAYFGSIVFFDRGREFKSEENLRITSHR